MSKSSITIEPSSFEENVQAYQAIPESEWMEVPRPGEILREEYMEPHGITAYRLAKATKLSQSHIGDILSGTRSITMETSYRLGKAFDMPPSFFYSLQSQHDELMTVRRHAKEQTDIPCLVSKAA
jgi:addiction module HigA family antidote